MIYRYNVSALNEYGVPEYRGFDRFINPHYFANLIAIAMDKQNIKTHDIKVRELMIPKDTARMESKNFRQIADFKREVRESNLPHYSIYLVAQSYKFLLNKDKNSPYTYDKDAKVIVLYRFPNSNNIHSAYVYHDGRIEMPKREHAAVLRESDELDRRIVFGFLREYYPDIIGISTDLDAYNGGENVDDIIDAYAGFYTADEQPKRFKIAYVESSYISAIANLKNLKLA